MLIFSLFCTVVLLVWMGFFMLGSLPLLVLKHDTPLDAGFIRGLFNVYYRATTVTAAAGALGYALAGRPAFALALAGIGGLGMAARQWFITRMDQVRAVMTAEDGASIRRFRQLHIAGMLLNFGLLLGFCFGMTRVTL